MSSGHIQRTYGDFRFSAAIHDQDPNNSSNILLVYNVASVPSAWNTSTLPWNREHVWPQANQPGSASNSAQGNLGDPHALRPANPSINADRANKPFGFSSTLGTYASLGAYWFPGDTDKGQIARSLFYSDTRWTSLGLSIVEGFPSGNQMGGLSSLIAWHYLQPPDEFERRRNHTIYSSAYNPQYFTNNRNAYVDRPEFVWSVYMDQMNDSTITIDGGVLTGGGGSTLDLVFGPVIVGSSASASQLVTLDKNGLDGTYYSIQVFQNATSDVSGFNNAFRTGTTDSATLDVGLQFDSNVPGVTDGLIVIDNLDVTTQGGAGNGSNDGDDFIELSISVLEHSNPSFSNPKDADSLLIELGDVELGDSPEGTSISISNLAAVSGAALTADLDLDSITETDPGEKFSISGPLFDNLVAGQSQQLTLNVVADELGSYSALFEFNLSDEDIPGATAQTITLTATMNVVEGFVLGDADDDGVLTNLDIAPFVLALTNSVAYQAMFPDVDPDVALDMNGDGVFDNLDIVGFVTALTG